MHTSRELIIPGAQWCEDSTADVCANRLCRKKLSLVFGRHHCRWCGRIFCTSCAPCTALYLGKVRRRCSACRVPLLFRSLYNSRTGRREAVVMQHILSFLDRRSINALLQSCYTILSEFHVVGYDYVDAIQDRFPTFFDGARIGRGGSGTVYKCEDRRRFNSPRVALKVITKSSIMSYSAWCKITRELEIMRGLDHPNVARLLEVFQTPLHLVIVMEAGEGGTLKHACEFVRRHHCDVEALLANVLAQVARGLDYLYSRKHIVHRDIKHDNIVLSRDYTRAIIIDFGLAEYVRDDKQLLFTPCGTLGFASPENIEAATKSLRLFEATPITMHRADIFSLGVVAYNILTGQRPLKGKRFVELIRDIRKGIHCDGPRWTNVSDSAKVLIEWMLKTDANERATALDVLDHPFITKKAPFIGEIAKKRNQELEISKEQEVNEWVYVIPSESQWEFIALDETFQLNETS
ncbi:Protein kinase domain [Trypanosoma melophagium]|uniref:Protein kinase domain n=1 Tax=Trypanosoma melophagium TaxID=715481 RepID=UPI00351AAC75|nr:Protein kinase domain [Trypanosoma melophagium]